MALATWWKGDPLPALAPVPGLTVAVCSDAALLAEINALDPSEVRARLDAGHRAYLAALDGVPVAYGWVATVGAAIGELDLRFALSDRDRYLWDFATLPAYRGRGIYPRLLQAILAREAQAGAERFWIIHAPENHASAAGIAKAGFQAVSELSFHRERGVGSLALDHRERARVGAAVLGVSLVEAVQAGRVLSPCWRCVMAARSGQADHVPCWERDGDAHACACIVPDRGAQRAGSTGAVAEPGA
ncbi:MAG: GNAT family N-acetyltransferase [Sphaerobacter sp.]|nr:GNAT family N-acetyltransferase [Sphaerobacter sp.]